jgi:hypothetical protein
MRLLLNLQKIDRRIMYVLLAVVVAIPLMWNVLDMPLPVMSEVQSSYNTIENMQPGKIAIVSAIWGPGTQAENRTQTEAIVRHLFKKGVPFILIPWDLQGTKIVEKLVEDLAVEYHKKEGVDWASTGYRPAYILQFIKAITQNMNQTLTADRRGISFAKLPITRNKTIDNVGLVVETTPSGTVQVWISFLGQTRDIPIIYCPTAVMVPEGYNYVDTKQVAGMLPGLVGAAQYDELLKHKGFSQRGANALSMAHALIIVLIILGNLGYIMSRRHAAQS